MTSNAPAFASWTATPAPVLNADAAHFGEVCRGFLGGPDGLTMPTTLLPEDQDSMVPQADLDAARVLIVERRGDSGRHVVTSVAGGRFAAWWPTPSLGTESYDHIADFPESYTITMTDGTVHEDVPSADVDPG